MTNGTEIQAAETGAMQPAQEVYAPQGKALAAPTYETAGMALAAQAKAQIEARYIIAQRMPRDIDVVRRKLLKECARPGFAESALYTIKRSGKPITGPSIRLAEAAMREMANIVIDTITVYDDEEKRIVRVTVTDVESNLSYSLDVNIRKAVERRQFRDGDVILRSRHNSRGETVYLIEANEGDLVIAQAAAVSKAIRTNGLRLVPGWLLDEAIDAIQRTLRDRDAKDPDAARRKLFDSFADLGIGPEKVKAWLGHDGERLTEQERGDLRGLYVALRDGEVTWAEVEAALHGKSERATTADATAALRERLAKRGAGGAAPGAGPQAGGMSPVGPPPASGAAGEAAPGGSGIAGEGPPGSSGQAGGRVQPSPAAQGQKASQGGGK